MIYTIYGYFTSSLITTMDAHPTTVQWKKIRDQALIEVRWQRFRNMVRWSLAGTVAAILCVLLLAYGYPGGRGVFYWILIALAFIPLVLCALAWLLPPHPLSLLQQINRHFKLTDDAFAAEHACQHESPWNAAILQRATQLIQQQDWRSSWPRSWPRGSTLAALGYLLVLALALFTYSSLTLSAESPPQPTFHREAVNDLATSLDQWSNEIVPPDEFKEQWEEMQWSLHETREKLLQTDLTERELILNLNQLEQQLSEWNQKAQQASAEQSMWQSEVSKTLEKLENFTEAAREMRKGELDKAADKLEEIASELQQDTTDLKSRQDYVTTQKSLQDLADQLRQQNMDSAADATEQLSQSLQRPGHKQDSKQAASQATQALAQSARSTAQKQDFLKSLKNMQQSMGASRDQVFQEPATGENDTDLRQGESQAESGDQNGNGASSESEPEQKGDGIGSSSGAKDGAGEVTERDFSKQEQLTGEPSTDGPQASHTMKTESFSQETTGSGANMDPATFENLSREAIEDESIPLIHRDTIRRYFENIRPRNRE